MRLPRIVGLLRRAAEAQSSERDAELSLLLAGAAAEAADDTERAVQNYEQAANRSPQSSGPVWALLRLGQRLRDQGVVLRAREALSEREKAKGQASVETLLLADHYELWSAKAELAEACLDATLTDPVSGHHAAVSLVSSTATAAELREQALEVLAQRSPEELKPRLLAELGGVLLAQGAEHARVLDVVERVQTAAPDNRWALWTRASIPLPHDEEGHASALENLARQTSDAVLAESLRAEACFVRALSAPEHGLEGSLVGSFEAPAELSPAVAAMLLEASSPIHDAGLRARAFATLRAQAPSRENALALARAQLAAEEPAAALEALDGLLNQNPGDVQALELGRIAARNAGNFQRVTELCEALASQVEGELSLQLLEEAAVVRMDELSDLRGSEELLVRILGQAPARKLAFTRLQDLLGARGETQRLITLMRARTELVDEADELIGLFYELARLYRASGDLDAALDAIDNVRMLDEHVGALALAVEIHTARESWAEAVEVLSALASAKFVPEAQRRLARLGAADFLERKLNDGPAALAQLDLIVQSGQRDAPLFTRIADVAERVGDLPRTIGALQSAIERTTGMAQAELRLRCGRILAEKSGARDDARPLFESVVNDYPSHLSAMQSLYAVSDDENRRRELLKRFEAEVRRELREAPANPEPLRKLLALGDLRGDAGYGYVALSTLRVIEAETLAEREAGDRLARKYASAPRVSVTLPASELNALMPTESSAAYQSVLRAVLANAGEIDQLEPGRFNAGRSQRLSVRDVNAVRDEITAMANVLGLKFTEFYVGGDDPMRIVAMPKDEELMFLVGSDVASPLPPAQRAQVALQLAGAYLQTLPILSRTPGQGARLMFAALVAAECALPGGIMKAELGDLPRSVGRALPRKTKKALPDLVRTLPDQGVAMEHHVRVALRQTRRLALLLAGHLAPALEQVLGALPSKEVVIGSEDALDLITTWTSSSMDALRSRLGFAR
ncbi:MAG: tetratricopeptide repeat protein [Myxococcales bacterium]